MFMEFAKNAAAPNKKKKVDRGNYLHLGAGSNPSGPTTIIPTF
jgi:hypothetical protein